MDLHQRRKTAYVSIFNSPQGQLVLEHLWEQHTRDLDPHDPNPNAALFQQAQAELIRFIERQAKPVLGEQS